VKRASPQLDVHPLELQVRQADGPTPRDRAAETVREVHGGQHDSVAVEHPLHVSANERVLELRDRDARAVGVERPLQPQQRVDHAGELALREHRALGHLEQRRDDREPARRHAVGVEREVHCTAGRETRAEIDEAPLHGHDARRRQHARARLQPGRADGQVGAVERSLRREPVQGRHPDPSVRDFQLQLDRGLR
jgi:hypothetical protein